jgi:hypothetical protein
MLRCVALVRTDVSEERSTYITTPTTTINIIIIITIILR